MEKIFLLIVIFVSYLGSVKGQNSTLSKVDSLVDVKISLSEKFLFDAKFVDAKKILNLSFFRNLDGYSPKHKILLTIQDIRVTGFMNIVHAKKTDPIDNFERLNSLLTVAEKLKDENVQALYFLSFSNTHRSIGNLDSALIYQKNAISLFQKNDNLEEIAKIRAADISRLHNQLLEEEKKQEVLDLIPKYLDEIEFSNYHSKYALAYNTRHLAQIHRRQTMNYEESLKLFKTSLTLREEIGFKPFIPASHSSLGDVYLKMGEYESAIEAYIRSLELAQEIGFVRYQSYPLLCIGDCYLNQNYETNAIEYYKKALEKATINNYLPVIDQANLKISEIEK